MTRHSLLLQLPLNAHALPIEFEISRWSIGCADSTMATLQQIQSAALLILKADAAYSYHWALKV
jgi:hypothetical protein